MGFKKENYTRMGTAMSMFLGIFLCISVPESQANTDTPPGDCLISVLEEPRPTSRIKGTRHVQSTKNNYRSAEWTGLKNGRILDNEFISAKIKPKASSASLTFNNFNFKVPANSEVTGMDLYVDGKAMGDSTINVETTKFYLLDGSGNKLGNNLNKAITFGNDWKEDGETHMWKYSINASNWGGNFTADFVNSTDFGILMEVRNHGEEAVEVFIDRVNIEVHYKPGLTLCNAASHLCFPFLGPRSADILGYNWILPGGFDELEDNDPKVYNLLLDRGREPGIYEICVEVTYATGTEQCCRKFEIVDCTPSSIGDFVWEDINGDGVQDEGEPGIDGIGIDLFDDTDKLIASTTTSNGSYSFENINRGCYYIQLKNFDGYIPSVGPGNFLDGSNGYGTTDYFTLGSDTELTDIDLGLVRPASIAGTIWHDVNANGTDDQEPTLGEVSLSLDGPQGTVTTTSDDAGNYRFDNLIPGDYKISVTTPNRYELSPTGAGGDDVSSDFNQDGMVSIEGIVSGDEITDIDGGFFKRGTIGDYVWYDFNVNGLQDEDESGIEGVEVILMNADGVVSRSTTDETGKYALNKVKPGNYHLAFTIGDDYLISIPNAGDDEANDSDVETLEDQMRTADFTFSSCDSLSNIDAGFIFKPGSIAGTIWSDDNRDHQRQPDESRDISTTVSLYNDSDVEIATETIQSDGTYLFGELQPGNFYVKFDAIDDHIFADGDLGSDDSDSDVTDADAGTTANIEITPDLQVTNVDAGYIYLVSSISGLAWEDEDRDHKRGADENTLGGVEVNLFFGNDELVQSTVTDDAGNYTFDELRRNDYYITFGGVQHYLFVSPNAGEPSESSSVTESVTTGSTDMISLAADTDLIDVNSGYIEEVGTVQGDAWEDVDLSGTNNDESPFENITVTMYDNSNQELRSTTTAADGTYTFELVPVGEYYVHFDLPTDFIYAESEAGNDDSIDSDISGANGEGTTRMVSIEKQDDLSELDGGYVINQGRVTGIIWKDNDEDGQRQDNEPTMEGINITLYDNGGTQVESTSSNASGEYTFEEITAGDYHIKVDIPDDNIFTPADQGDDATDSDITESNGDNSSDDFEVLTGRRTTTVDAGGVDNFGNILGVTWCDVNEDGILETSEEPVEGIEVKLLTESGQELNTTTTGQGGAYSFLEVPAGTYYLVFEDEADKEFTLPNVGDDELVNSSVNSSLTNGSSFVFRVGAGNKDYIKNAGYQYLPGSISGQSWIDENSNAVNDDQAGFAGMTVTLYDASNTEIATTTTANDGTYGFESVDRGDYYVVFANDENYLRITSSQSEDSKITNSTQEGGTDIFAVVPNRETSGIDGGHLYALGSITGNAWIDNDDNGLDDDGVAFDNVTVTLYDDEREISSTTTDGNGNYIFDDIYFGEYYVVFDDQTNYLFTTADAGDDTIDSDVTGANGDGSTDEFILLPNSTTENIDGGYTLATGSVSGQAWIDDNDNDTNDDGNAFEGIEVLLMNAVGDRITTTTNSDGTYLFEDVLQGTYTLFFEQQSDYDFVTPNVGDEDKDSDVTGEGTTDPIEVVAKNETTNVDAGYVLGKGSIAGIAWLDENDNDTNDENNGISGIEVSLVSSDGDVVTILTNQDGSYLFEDVFPGSYIVLFSGLENHDFVDANVGDETTDSDVTGTTNGLGNTDQIVVGPREEINNVDAGYMILTGAINGKAWVDADRNAINDDQMPLEGIEVSLFLGDERITSSTTNGDGFYSFGNVLPGDYTISFGIDNSYEFAEANQGDDDTVDSDVIDENGNTATITVEPGKVSENIDAGYQMRRGGVAGTAWQDENRNGINDDDQPLAGISVELYTSEGELVESTQTNDSGDYMIADFAAGDYYLVFQSTENNEFTIAGEGDEDQDSDVTASNGDGSTDTFSVAAGEVAESLDAGYVSSVGNICGIVWSDDNTEDGLYTDADEVQVQFLVELENVDGESIAETVTDGDGGYCFLNLPQGEYRVVFRVDDGLEYVEPNQGTDQQVDSDVTNRDEGKTDLITLDAGSSLFYNAGIQSVEVVKAFISGRVWKDNDSNNIYSDGDDLFEGLNISLLSEAGEILSSTTSGADGGYTFDNLDDGAYIVYFENREGHSFVEGDVGNDPNVDSDVITSDSLGNFGITPVLRIMDAGSYKYIDAGILMDMMAELGSVSGTAWRDSNNDGINDDDESGLAGIEVRLFNNAGEEIANSSTDDQGNYSFGDLSDGSYYVVFEDRDNYEFVAADQGDDDSKDSDVTGSNGNGSTDPFEISEGSDVANIDAGYFTELELYSIRGRAFLDANDNNVDDEEEGFSGIQVFLLDSLDQELAVTTTSNDGTYSFENLESNAYVVVFGLPDGEEFVSANEGDDDTIDSDVEFVQDGFGATNVIFLSSDISNVDAGFKEDEIQLKGSLCGTVWRDSNKNDINDDNNPIADLEIILFMEGGAEIAVTTSDTDGNYCFTDLDEGHYYVFFDPISNYDYVASNVGDDDSIDSDVTGILGDGNTDAIFVAGGDNIEHVDAGYYTEEELYSISGRAFIDADENGVDDNEDGFVGVQVFLLDSLDNELGITTTDADGNYRFTDLSPETYVVAFQLPNESTFTDANVGDDDTVDSDVEFIQDGFGATNVIVLNDNIEDVDAGIITAREFYSICGKVWLDDGDGIRTNDESGLQNIMVFVVDSLDTQTAQATTDQDGNYCFDNLEKGTYAIVFLKSDEYKTTPGDAGDDDTVDSDAIFFEGDIAATDVIVLNSDKENVDAGFSSDLEFYSISGRAWIDVDEDHINNDDAPFSGIQVFLLDSLDAQAATATTDSLGNYIFNNVPEGTYGVVFTLPPNYRFSEPNVGDDESLDSDVILSQNNLGAAEKINLTSDLTDIDAGYIPEESSGLSIAGNTFIDTNENGLDDDGAPLPNVTVVLFDSTGVEITRVTSDDMGAYSFNDIDTGFYYTSFWLDSTYVFTQANVGDDDTIDSDVTNVEESSGSTEVFDLMMSITDLDAGYISTDTTMMVTGNLAGRVWEDTDPNGIREDGEPGVVNVDVVLLNEAGDQVASTTTDDGGNYSFNNIPIGDYRVRFDLKDDQIFVIGDAGDDDTIDSDVIQADGSTTTYTITENTTVENVDAGILTELPQASLCGNVWIDINENGINDEGEDGLIGMLINIYNENGEFVDSTRTTTNGFYSSTDLLGGYYYLEFDSEGDYYFTEANVGEEGFDSDVTEANGEGTTDVFLGSGKIKLDAGLIPETGSYISGKVWGDTDENNAYNEGDLLIEGQQVFLVNRVARVIASTTTAADGTYRFDIGESGEYAVFFATNDELQFVTPDASGDDETDSDVIDVIMLNGTFGTTNLINFSMGQRIKNVDAGFVMTMEREESITGVVWMDGNEDALRQEDEQGLAGVEVKLYNSNDELIATTTTGADGSYVFMDLDNQDYYIEFVKTSGEFVDADQGDDDSIDSDVQDAESGRTMIFTFESGTPMSFDAGIMGEVEVNTICGIVWNDTDQNNLRVSEQGRADHTVFLLADGEVIDTTTTGSDGTYAFTNLEPGTYRIQVESVDGYGFSEQDAGDDDTIDSDVKEDGLSDNLEVGGKVTVDAGVYFSVVGLSGKVWGDTNEDNIYNEGDILIEGHTVYLVNQTARVLATTTSAADGTYSFSGLSSGTYAVFFDYIEGEEFVTADAGDDESKDSDVIDIITQIGPYGYTNLVEYEENTSQGDIDAGIIRTPSTTGFVAGVVWIDSEEDGIRQEDEELFSGIEVKLFQTDGTEVATTTTDDNGAYQFENVSPGDYYVEFTLNGREFVDANLGDDDRVDSDVEDLSSGRSGNFDVEVDMTTRIDAGIKPAQNGIAGTVWFDFNENGRQDSDEDGIPQIEVKLFSAGGDEVAKTETDQDGAYSFSDLEAGDYYIEVGVSSAFQFTDAKVGDDEGDSDITDANGDGTSDTFSFNNGLLRFDAGQVSSIPSFISGQVWEDGNGNHILDDTDMGVGAYTAYLLFDGAIIDTAMTEPDGTYKFDNIAVGEYIVLFEKQDGKFFALPNIPDQENKDSDVIGMVEVDGVSYGATDAIFIGSGQVKVNVDAGITETEQNPGSISGQIWLDGNDNNSRDDDEGPIEGAVVTLYDGVGGTIGMQEIGSEGTYTFRNLIPGNYAVQFTIPSEYNFVEADQGDEDRDSDVLMFDGQLGLTDVIVVGDGEDVTNIDGGVKIKTVSLSSIGDVVWLDLDEDGILDDDELGMNEVNVELFDALSGEMVGSMLTTDHPEKREPGYYSFENLEDGEYYLRFNLPNGYIFSNPKMGTQEIKDSDVTGANGTGTTNIIKVDKIQMTDIDVGAIKTNKAVIGDMVFNDRNENGIQDLGEDGINNIRVRLFDTDNQQVAQAFTQYNRAMDRAGYFSFKVDPGTYYLRFDISQGLSFTNPDVGDDDERDSDVTGENGFGTTPMFEVEASETMLGMDAGLITEPANLGDRLWVDENSNGVFDANEEGINGVAVSLYDNEHNLVNSTTTQSVDGRKGRYLFENISAGQYYIGFDLPEDYVATTPNIGGNDANDSDITNVFGKGTTSLFTLSSGEDELDIDGGIVLGASIGDFAWDDNDGDGIQDGNEPGREGVFVKLLNANGDLIDTTSTDQNGAYIFDGLVEGEYRLDFEIPVDRAMTTTDAGGDDDEDSDPAEDGMTGLIAVGYNEDVEHVDAGFVSNSVAFNSGVENELIAKVFPNPTMRFITLETNNIYEQDAQVHEVKIFDSQGLIVKSFNEQKLLKRGGTKTYELDLEGVNPGVYYIRAKVGKLTYNKKLILINN